MAISAAFFFGLLLAVGSEAAEGIWPSGQDLIYDYTADVRAAGLKPAHVGSKYSIYGKLLVQADGEDAIVKLDDVRYQLYNGDLPEVQQPSSLPIPEEATPLTTPFRIHYKDGKVKKLFTQSSDPLWALNMKKGLASLLQLDLTKRMRMDMPSAFWGEENSIFGTCDVGYSFTTEGDTNIVTKTVNPETCKDYPFQKFSNMEQYSCEGADKENPISALYKRFYRVEIGGDKPVMKALGSEFKVAFLPLRANSDLDYVNIQQQLVLTKSGPIKEKLAVVEAQELQDLTFSHPETDTLLGTGLDWSQGRVKLDTDSLAAKAVSQLDEILQYQKEAHIDVTAPSFKRLALLDNYVSLVLGRLGVENLGAVFTQLSQGTSEADIAKRDLFIKLLPQVGTQAAAVTVRNLIRKHKVKTWTAQTLLQNLPLNIRHPTEKLLQETEDLINLDNEFSEEVRNAAILSFGSLVYRTVKDNTNEEFRNRTVNKYAEIYFKQITQTSNDFAKQFTYLQGLANMKVGASAEYLEYILMEGADLGRHVQLQAARFTLRNVLGNYNKAYRIFWPILVNSKQHLELRAYALMALVESANSMDHHLAIHSYMKEQRNNVHLYKLYYKLLKAKTSTTDPCLASGSVYADRVLRCTQEPLVDHFGTGIEVFDFTDKVYGFGKALRLQSIADHTTGYPSVLFASFHETLYGNMRTPFSVYLKLEGLDQVLWGLVAEGDGVEPTKAPSKVDMMGLLRRNQPLNAAELIRKVSQAQEKLQKPIHIELSVYKNDHAIYTLYLNNSVLDRLVEQDIPLRIKELKNLFQNMNLHQVDFPATKEFIMPTDLGVPLAFTKDETHVMSLVGNTKMESNLMLELTSRRSSFSAIRATIFNPIAGSWHGIQKIITHDAQLPLRVGLKRDEAGLKVVIGSPEGAEGLNAAIGSRWYTQTSSFLFEEQINNNLLGASCGSCKRVAVITKDKNQHREDVVLIHQKIPATGLVADVRVIDCERPISVASVKKLIYRFMDQTHMNAHHSPLMRTIIALNHLATYLDFSPASGQCGVVARFIRDPEVGQGSHVEFSLKVTGGEVPGGNIVLQGVKLRAIGEWVLKGTNDEVVQKTDIRLDISTTAGQEDNKVGLQLANYNGNKPNSKACWSLSKKYPARKQDALAFGWGNEESDSQLSINIGSFTEDVDGDCPSDAISVVINLKGEISDEQKQRAQGDEWPYGQCKEDKQKSEWADSGFVPNTQACYQGAILLTTARKLTYSLSHGKLPSYVEDIIRYIEEHYRTAYAQHFTLMPAHSLAEPNTAEVVVQYSAYKPTVDIKVKTPTRHYGYLEVPTGASSADDYNPALDNTHMSRFHMMIETMGISKPCFVSSENIYTPDNATIAHKQTGDWALVAGIAGNPNKFSAYTKSQGGAKPLVVKIVNDGVSLELSRDGAKLNGNAISLEQGVQYPADDPNYAVRVWKMGDLVMAYSRRTAVYAYYTGTSVDIEQPIINRGRAAGLCGNLNGDPTDD